MKLYKFIPLLVFIIALGTYLSTLTPTVDFIDSAEFATVAATLGIAHPTGYPLYTLLGHLFSKIPIADRIIVRLNILSAFFAALGAGVFTLFLKIFLTSVRKQKNAGRDKESSTELADKMDWLVALTGGLALAWSGVFWEVGTTLEVYSLHAVFVTLLLYLSVRFAAEENKRREMMLGLLFFLFLGFSFANHLTTALLLPAFFYLFITKWRKRKTPLPSIILIMIPILLGLSLYLYLPLRARAHPEVMWGEPTTLKAIWNHLSVVDFRHRILLFPETGDTPGRYIIRLLRTLASEMDGDSLLEFFQNLPRRMGFVPIPFILLGIALLYLQSRRFFYFLLLAFIPPTFYAATYNVPDNLFYYNPGYICLVVFAAFGFRRFFILISGQRRQLVRVLVLIPLITAPAFISNYPAVNKRNNYFIEDFIHNLFSTIEPNALLFALDVHILIHPLYYYQKVENFRTDVIVLPNHGLQKGWFARQLKYHHPELYQKSKKEIEDYCRTLATSDPENREQSRRLNQKYYRMLGSIIAHNFEERPIYITSEFNPRENPFFHPGFQRVPEGLAWRLYRPEETPGEFSFRKFSYRELSYPHKDADAIRHAYMYMFLERANYENSREKPEEAAKWLQQGLEVYPEEELVSDTYNGRVVVRNRRRDLLHNYALTLGNTGRYEEAMEATAELIRFSPGDPRGYSVRGILLVQQGRREEARSAFQEGLASIPDNPMLLQNLRTVEAAIRGGGGAER